MRGGVPTALTTLSFLFFAQAQRAYFATLLGLTRDALSPGLRPAAVLLAALPLAVLLAPLLPLARWLDRRAAVALAVAGIAIFRVPMTLDAFAARAVSAPLVVGCVALFLTWGVGYIERRALAIGAIAGLLADQLLRLAGTSWDLALRPAWLPVQAVLSLALLGLAFLWLRMARKPVVAQGTRTAAGGDPAAMRSERAGEVESLERRAGGLRLRGALALGPLLFLELHILGLPPVVSRWTGLAYGAAGMALAVAAALALGVAMAGPGMVRARPVALFLAALAGSAVLGGWFGRGHLPAMLMAGGHSAALLLIARTLNPAGGRRSRGIAVVGMGMFVGLTALYAATYFGGGLGPFPGDGPVWVFVAAAVLLLATAVLTPRPPALQRVSAPFPAGLVAAAVVVIAALIIGVVQRPEPGAPPAGAVGSTSGASERVRAAAYDIRSGYDEGWRFDPAAIAAVIEAADADVVALREVAVGLPTAYGVDLALWLGRRLGTPTYFAPTIHRLRGEAFMSRLPTRGVEAIPLRPADEDRTQLLRLHAVVGDGTLPFHTLRLDAGAGRAPEQVRAALDRIAPGPAVLLADLSAGDGSPVAAALRSAGFRDAFELAAAPGAPTAPTEPWARLDRVWVRELTVEAAAVHPAAPSAHRLVIATLQVPATGRSPRNGRE